MELGRIGERVRERVSVATYGRRSAPNSDDFKTASESALNLTRRFGLGAGKVAVEAVSGAIKAADEITGETTEFVRDAVVGVIEGTNQVARAGRPVVRDVVSAAVRSSTELGGSIPEASQRAVEGAIVGAAAVGVESGRAGVQASAGVAAAVRELGGDFREIVAPAVHGLIIGVVSTSGDLFEASRDMAKSLIANGASAGEDPAELGKLILDEAIRATRIHKIGTTDAVMGSAQGCLEAAYELGPGVGHSVRGTVLSVVDAPINALAPSIKSSISEALTSLSDDLGARPQAWRGVAIWRACVSLFRVTGIDVGAALAYYMMLAFFPLLALVVIALSSFVDPERIRSTVTEVVAFYYPASQQAVSDAMEHLFAARLAAGLIAFGGMILGAMGLFMAANRGVNRVFGRPPRKPLSATASTVAIVVLAVLLFLMSIGMTVVFQVLLNAAESLPDLGLPLSKVIWTVTRVVSGVAPFIITGLVFMVVYKYLPNDRVRWSDATFGALVTVVIFEVAKNLFFFSGKLVSQHSVLYGSLSSIILLLVWSHVGGVIFLYGAALTKQAMDLRPEPAASTRRRESEVDDPAKREADIALGRSQPQWAWRNGEDVRRRRP